MGKRRFTESAWRTDTSFRALCKAFLRCKTENEMANFLRDIGTLAELKTWSERLEVASQLKAGKTYRAIASLTGASTTTVTRVADYLENGVGGYKKIFAGHHHAANSANREEKPVSVLKKYLEKTKD